MLQIIADLNRKDYNSDNPFSPEAKVAQCDSLLKLQGRRDDFYVLCTKAKTLLETGDEKQAVAIYEKLKNGSDSSKIDLFEPDMGLAYMRLGERTNCMLNHNRTSCIYPLTDSAFHVNKTGSRKAIAVYQDILRKHPADLTSRWLLNIAYMTLGAYPDSVPKPFLLPDLNKTLATIRPFTDMAADVGINLNSRAGGAIADDFNNDGYIDIVTSGTELDDHMHYFQNNRDGTFTDKSAASGLLQFTGGLNIQQTDYNNDGKMDIFVLRGAWKKNGFGNQPSSLLRNNGDGTFTDVTISAGLLFYHPTQAAVWADFNNDGWLDVFIGAEGFNSGDSVNIHRSMLYMNNHDGTFTEVGHIAHCDVMSYVKGATSADYNNDGWPDLFLSTMDGRKYLLKNKGKKGAVPDFEDATANAGIAANTNRTFTTWFFDYNNDGWPDILIADYKFDAPLGYYAAAESLGKPVPRAGNIYLYKNNHNGTFTEVSKQTGLDKVVFSMGANFGDIDNDGFPDLYFGTGNPDFGSLIPNKLFKNVNGERFEDVTSASRTGNLQKGHGVAFADFRNRGLQDIFIEMGGAYAGDAYTSSLYVNPGQNKNSWIAIKAIGIKSNKSAIGSRLKISFTENGIKRSVYKDINSGGSFGSSPIQAEIGLGQARVIDELRITWAGSNTVQCFHHLAVNQFYHIIEGNNEPTILHLKKLSFVRKNGMATSMKM